MLRFEWNALRPGDHVLVHDPRTAEMALASGVVTGVDRHERVNGVGIRVERGERAVLWPSPFVVHHDPRDPAEPCWRCEELAERAEAALHHPSVGAEGADRAGPAPMLGDIRT